MSTITAHTVKAPPLSRADEVTLARRIERGDLAARQTMIERNLGLVHAVAKSYMGFGLPPADLVQEGTLGLARAVERFDHRRGVRFSTYAVAWIRRSIRDAVGAARVIRIPPKANRQLAAVRRAEAEIRREGGRQNASDAEIADFTELSIRTVGAIRGAGQVIASLDEPVGEDDSSLVDLIADPRALDPSDAVIGDEEREDVRAMLRLLPPRHQEVLVGRYGLGGLRVQSHAELGRRLGVGEERSRQLERESLHRLRSIAHARVGKAVPE
jgi:RNA polymerase primary sigma factor